MCIKCDGRMDVRLDDQYKIMRAELQRKKLAMIHHSKTGIKTEPKLVECDVGQANKKDFEVTNNNR